ncbi:hypothetical protein PIB30_010842 [Stylosanthes scabra]|uniref:Uncharacterized protein n=1 Tax=Stylosanthes scabra TaxID=79078 RepID=A0ABU6R5Y7_9FABA|nr:hypothetical protein [Stylosanthes scabra]
MGRPRKKLKKRLNNNEEEAAASTMQLTSSSRNGYSPIHLNPIQVVTTEKHADPKAVSSRRASLRSAAKRIIQPCQALPCPQQSTSTYQTQNECIGTSVSPTDYVHGYKVKHKSMPILKKIIAQHGDIAKDCTLPGKMSRSMLLEMIIDIIQELQDNDLDRIEEDYLQDMIDLVKEFRSVKLEVDWLLKRLQDILEASRILKQSCMLEERGEIIGKAIQAREKDLERCQTEKRALEARIQTICEQEAACKELLVTLMDETSRIRETISSFKPKVDRFSHSLAGDLL